MENVVAVFRKSYEIFGDVVFCQSKRRSVWRGLAVCVLAEFLLFSGLWELFRV